MSDWKRLEKELEDDDPAAPGSLEDLEWSDAEKVTPEMIVREDADYHPDGRPVKTPSYRRSTIPGLPPRRYNSDRKSDRKDE